MIRSLDTKKTISSLIMIRIYHSFEWLNRPLLHFYTFNKHGNEKLYNETNKLITFIFLKKYFHTKFKSNDYLIKQKEDVYNNLF